MHRLPLKIWSYVTGMTSGFIGMCITNCNHCLTELAAPICTAGNTLITEAKSVRRSAAIVKVSAQKMENS